MENSIQGLRVDATLDLRGTAPPDCFAKSRKQLDSMEEESVLELFVEEGDVLRSLPYALRAEGHEILVSEPTNDGIRFLLRKRSLLAG